MAKVILVDNLDRDSVADELLKDGLNEDEAFDLAREYNAAHSENSPMYAKVVSDNHKLWGGLSELY